MRALRATYRVQFGPEFTFAQADSLVPYWSVLGISHLYASPVFAARPGSLHGYDVIDHARISPELGGEEGLRRLAHHLHAAGMGLILDVVPNHTGVGGHENDHWLGLLEFGEAGPDNRWFDVDWTRGPLVLPVLGETLAEAITAGSLVPFWDKDRGQIAIRYFDHQLPLAPQTVARLITAAAKALGRSEALVPLATAWRALGDGNPTRQTIAALRARLQSEMLAPELEAKILALLGQELADPDEAMETQRQLFEQQYWRLAHWRIARDELNYRRFFSISDLAALRVEDPEVFETIHALPLRLLAEGVIDGLRVDHVDGLADPAAYCRKLRDETGPMATIHVEKILGADEDLRPWPIDGTTGYELLNLINGLFIDPDGYAILAERASALGLLPPPGCVDERVATAKREILDHSFVTELGQLTKLAKSVADRSLQTADFSEEAIRRGLSDLVVAFPVYRSYLSDTPCDPLDRALVEAADAAIGETADPWQQALRDFLRSILITDDVDEEILSFRRRFQQLTAPLMAKGYEDTELYRHIVLLSVNEVGCSLREPAVSPETFHRKIARLKQDWPRNLVPLATHDTKWGADARARLNLLSETAPQWGAATEAWSKLVARLNADRDEGHALSSLDEMRLFQAMMGSWPVSEERLGAYLVKAIREARQHGNWETPDPDYEARATELVQQCLDGAAMQEFRDQFSQFLAPVIAAGRLNAIAQMVIQLTIHGVPDIYWGNEFWDHSLVDPDNRRPIDWAQRMAALQALPALSVALDLTDLDADPDGRIKLAMMQRLLSLRYRWPALFEYGEYVPLTLGDDPAISSRWLAYARQDDEVVLIVVLPLRGLADSAALGPEGATLQLPDEWVGFRGRDIVSGVSLTLQGSLTLSSVLSANPIAVILAHPGAVDD